MTGLLSWWVLHAPLFAASFCSIYGALLITKTLWRRRQRSLDEIGRRELTAHYAKLIETLPAFDPSTRTSISKKSWNKLKGYAKMGGAITVASIIVIGVVSGFTGASLKARTEIPSYSTIGCKLPDSELDKCSPDTVVTVLAHNGNHYLFAQKGLPNFSLTQCPNTPEWPFNPMDRIRKFVFQEDYNHQCQLLGAHWSWYAVRDATQLTDSEQEEQHVRRRPPPSGSL